MTSSILVPGAKRDPGSSEQRSAPDAAWTVLAFAGAALALVGLLDLGLTWIPLRFGIPEWEFGTVTASLNALPVLSLGLAMLLAAGLARGRRRTVRTICVALGILAAWIVASALLYATNLPFILQAAGQPEIAEGLRKSLLKTGVQVVLYPTVFVSIAVYGWRQSSRRRS